MSVAVAELEAKIRSLGTEERTELVRALIADMDGPPDAAVESAWLDEARRRQREIVEGRAQLVPGAQVFENLRVRLGR